MNSISRLALVSFLLLPIPALAGENPLIFQDNFDEELKDSWSWVRGKPDARLIRNGGLEIRIFPGALESARNLLVRPAPELTRKGTPEIAWLPFHSNPIRIPSTSEYKSRVPHNPRFLFHQQ